MAVEPEENAGSLHNALFRQMHAPVQVLVDAVIGSRDERLGEGDVPPIGPDAHDDGRHGSEHD